MYIYMDMRTCMYKYVFAFLRSVETTLKRAVQQGEAESSPCLQRMLTC